MHQFNLSALVKFLKNRRKRIGLVSRWSALCSEFHSCSKTHCCNGVRITGIHMVLAPTCDEKGSLPFHESTILCFSLAGKEDVAVAAARCW
jgi:hypothetical protein